MDDTDSSGAVNMHPGLQQHRTVHKKMLLGLSPQSSGRGPGLGAKMLSVNLLACLSSYMTDKCP
jgi:hypothetical protein